MATQETSAKQGTPKKVRYVKSSPNTVTRFFGEVDRPFLLIVVLLVCVGIITLFSSSYSFSETYYHDSYYLAKPQLRYALVGLGLMAIIAFLAQYILPVLQKAAMLIYLIALVFNYLVPVVGVTLGGATRWLVVGPISFQPSELLKFSIVVVSAKYMNRFQDRMNTFTYGILMPIIIIAPPLLATLLQSHLSATIINLLLMYTMMWIGGTCFKQFTAFTAVIAGLAASVLTFGRGLIEKIVPHALSRLDIWENPFAFMSKESGGKGWQPVQSLYAISSGGFWGVGFGRSNQKHGYLPEPYNDYIFAILCEETGFFGAVLVIGLFAAFAWRGLAIARKSKDRFGSLLAAGITCHVIIQVILNLAVVTNSIPSTGINLPFFSNGGTSLIILLCEMGMILGVSRYSYEDKAEQKRLRQPSRQPSLQEEQKA